MGQVGATKNRLFSAIYMLAIGAALFAFAARCGVHLTSNHYNLSAEGNGLFGVLRVADGKALYASKTERPYSIYLYPPVHAWFTGTVLRSLGLSNLHTQILSVRFISLACLLLSFWLVWNFIAKREGADPTAFGIGLFLVFSKFADYATTGRNDALSLLLEVLAFLAFVRWWKQKGALKLSLFVFLCILSLATRQTGIAVIGGSLLFLAFKRQWKAAMIIGGSFSVISATLVYLLNLQSNGAFIDQAFFANIRYKPREFGIWSLSFLSFCLSYLVFGAALLWGAKLAVRNIKTDTQQLLLVVTGTTAAMSLFLFFRAGGDVNYFFEAMLFGTVLSAIAIKEWKSRVWFKPLIAIQLSMIAGIVGIKTVSAHKLASLPYETAAKEIRKSLQPYILLDGRYSPALALHLRNHIYHGPDVTSAGNLGRYAHERFRWTMRDTYFALDEKKVHTIVRAHPGCARNPNQKTEIPISGKRWLKYTEQKYLFDWLCIYRRPEDPTGKILTLSQN